jgi:hypothetical protein
MVTEDDETRTYMSLNPWRFNEVVCLEIRQSPPQQDRQIGLTVGILLRPSNTDGPDTSRLHLVFHEVVDMRLEARAYFQLTQIEIFSIRDRGWERLNYLVHETEEDFMRFYCHRFEARLVAGDADKISFQNDEL